MDEDETSTPETSEQDSPGAPASAPSTGSSTSGASGASGVSRRRFFQAGAVGAAATAALGFAGGRATADEPSGGPSHPAEPPTESTSSVDLSGKVRFYTGGHQAGIATPPQHHCVFMTFDLTTTDRRDLQVLLARWSAGIAQLMEGLPIGTVQPKRPSGVPVDTGEALGLEPASLTVTLGLGPGVFDDRFGLADRKPKRLEPLPKLPSDQLTEAWTGGDLCLQACANDPQVAYHAIRDLARIGRGTVNTRWTVLGFGRASAGKGQETPRNLLGFKDGTRNLRDADELDRFVWLGEDSDEVDWMRGGTYQVARKIRMHIETWDADRISDQQSIFGRTKVDGAPLTGKREFDTPDFTATGKHAISPTSHIALAAHENNDGTRILRRSFNFTDGINEIGHLDAGLLFLCFMKDPAAFIKLQTKLGSADRLNEYIAHIGSAIFAVPPAPARGHYLGEALFT